MVKFMTTTASKKNFAVKTLLVAGTFVALAGASPKAHALTATFDLTTPQPVNFSSNSYSNNGINLLANSAQGVNLPTDALNTNSAGFCAFAEVGTSSGRCALAQGSNAIKTGFSFTFDRSVWLRSFDVSQFANLSQGASISFQSGSQNQAFVLNGIGGQSFTGDFLATAGTPVVITADGTPLAANGGVFRINNFSVEDVPGPLPLLGIGSAFMYSRKLRRKTISSN